METSEMAQRILGIPFPSVVNSGPPGIARFRCMRCGGAVTNTELWHDDVIGWVCLPCGPDTSDLSMARYQDFYRGGPYEKSSAWTTTSCHLQSSRF